MLHIHFTLLFITLLFITLLFITILFIDVSYAIKSIDVTRWGD